MIKVGVIGYGYSAKIFHIPLIETETGCYQQYYVGIADTINKGVESPVSCEDAVNVIKILELADESHRAGISMSLSKIKKDI